MGSQEHLNWAGKQIEEKVTNRTEIVEENYQNPELYNDGNRQFHKSEMFVYIIANLSPKRVSFTFACVVCVCFQCRYNFDVIYLDRLYQRT